jgi:hypothetical protein
MFVADIDCKEAQKLNKVLYEPELIALLPFKPETDCSDGQLLNIPLILVAALVFGRETDCKEAQLLNMELIFVTELVFDR